MGGFKMENVFNIKYNTELDKLQILKKRRKIKIFEFILNHKFFSMVLTSFIVLSGINFYLIYSFIKVLENY